MKRALVALLLAAGMMGSSIASANAAPEYGNAIRDAARMGSQITPHGVFDAF